MANAIKEVLFLPSPQSGGEHIRIWQGWQMFTAEPLNGAVTIDSIVNIPRPVLGIELVEMQYFGLWVKLAGATPSVSLSILQSWDDVAADYVVPDANGVVKSALADTNPHIYSVLPTPMPRLRLRAVGGGGNGADTTITAILWAQG